MAPASIKLEGVKPELGKLALTSTVEKTLVLPRSVQSSRLVASTMGAMIRILILTVRGLRLKGGWRR